MAPFEHYIILLVNSFDSREVAPVCDPSFMIFIQNIFENCLKIFSCSVFDYKNTFVFYLVYVLYTCLV